MSSTQACSTSPAAPPSTTSPEPVTPPTGSTTAARPRLISTCAPAACPTLARHSRREPGAGGFVSTNEVQGLTLSGAGVGALAAVGGSPLLFDSENSTFIHLDARASSSNLITGVVRLLLDARASR